jgi:hypothetical protein
MHRRGAFSIIEAAVSIWHEQRHGSTGCLPKSDATKPLDMIIFDSLTPTTPISTLAAAQFSVDEFIINNESGRKATHYGDASRAMRFASGLQGEFAHTGNVTAEVAGASSAIVGSWAK